MVACPSILIDGFYICTNIILVISTLNISTVYLFHFLRIFFIFLFNLNLLDSTPINGATSWPIWTHPFSPCSSKYNAWKWVLPWNKLVSKISIYWKKPHTRIFIWKLPHSCTFEFNNLLTYFKINIATINIFKIRSIIELKKLSIHDSLIESMVEP